MNNVTSRPKEQFVHSVFESIAPKYDMMNDLLSFRRHKAWRKFTMKKMNMQPGNTAIDLCCGTCDWTISMAEASGGQITGLDFSENMLKFGRRKVNERSLSDRISLVQGDAMGLPFEDNSFVITSYSIHYTKLYELSFSLTPQRFAAAGTGKRSCRSYYSSRR